MIHSFRVASTVLLIPLVLVAAMPAQAQETFRIGFVNPDRVLREAQPAKLAQAKLESEFLKRERDVASLGEALKTASEKFEREATTLPESQRIARQRALGDQEREFSRRRREFQEDLNTRKNEELQQVYDRANRVVKQVAEAEKYDAILQEAIYINPKHDITEKVIKALNNSVPSAAAPTGGK